MKHLGMIEFIQILSHYELGEIRGLISVMEGRKNGAVIARADTGDYILRKCPDEQRAVSEFYISEHLKGVGVASEILLTFRKWPYAKFQNQFFNLQRKIEGNKLTSVREDDVRKIGTAVGTLAKSFQTFDRMVLEVDEYALKNTVTDRTKEKLLQIEKGDRILAMLPEMEALDKEGENLIHGDLGTYNMLMTDEKAYILDFGETRKGHPYFDIAASMTTAITTAGFMKEHISYIDTYLSAYAEACEMVDRALLVKYIALWYIRQIFAALKEMSDPVETVEEYISALSWFLRNLKVD